MSKYIKNLLASRQTPETKDTKVIQTGFAAADAKQQEVPQEDFDKIARELRPRRQSQASLMSPGRAVVGIPGHELSPRDIIMSPGGGKLV